MLILSARSQLSDKVAGLDLGADDYLTKPFALENWRPGCGRCCAGISSAGVPCTGGRADPKHRDPGGLRPWGTPSLTPREFAILEHLMLHRGCWISQEELMEHIWEADANPFSNAVRMHISSLRKKLRKRLGHDPIQTKVGRGYRLAGEETA